MDYIKIRFGQSLEPFAADLERALEGLFRDMGPRYAVSTEKWKPQMDIYESPDQIMILAEVAGVAKDDLVVELEPRAIRIAGRRTEVPRGPGTRFHLAEIAYGEFERVVYLPSPVDPDKVTATYANGLLQVRMAKRGPSAPRMVAIRESDE